MLTHLLRTVTGASRVHQLLRLAFLLLGGAVGSQANAQCVYPCVTNQGPAVSLTSDQASVSQGVVQLSAYVSDDDLLYLGSWSLTRNGTPVSLISATTNYYGNYFTTTGTDSLVSGTNTLIASMCDAASPSVCAADTLVLTYSPVVSPPTTAAPVATLAHDNNFRLVDGCATCAPATLSYSTPSIVKEDIPRNATLVYSSEAARPKGYLEVDAVISASTVPHRLSIQLKRRSTGSFVTLTNGGTEAFVQGATGTIRLAAQFDASAYATGSHLFDVIVSAHWGSSAPYTRMSDTLQAVRVFIRNEQSSPYGSGWMVAGAGRIYSDSAGVTLVGSDGTLRWFAEVGCGGSPWTCTYTSPTGDFSTLTRHLHHVVPTDTVWTLADRAGGRLRFTALGLSEMYLNRYNTGSYFTYEVAGGGPRIKEMFRAVYVNGTLASPHLPFATFTYNGTTNKLAEITLADGRKSKFAIHASDSIIITDPDSIVALRATFRADTITSHGRNKASSVLHHDAFGQVLRVISPTFTIDGGTSANDTTRVQSLRAKLLTGQASTVSASASAAVQAAYSYLELKQQNGTKSWTWGHHSGKPSDISNRDSLGTVIEQRWTYNTDYLPTFSWSTGSGGIENTWSGPLLTEERNLGSGNSTKFWYRNYDQIDSVRVNNVRVLRQFFSSGSALHPDSILSDSANVTRLTYDLEGRVLTVTDARGAVSTTVYSLPTGNATSVTTSASGVASATTSIQHDSAGRVWKVTDPNGRVFESKYDKLDRLKQSIAPLSNVMTYAYNDTLREQSATDALGNVHTEKMNPRGWVVAKVDPRGKIDSLFYDPLGRVVRHKDRRANIQTTYQHDGLGRTTRRIATNGATIDTTLYGYGQTYDGRWVSAKNSESLDTVFVDPGGRLQSTKTVRDSKTYRMTYGYVNATMLNRITVVRDSLGFEKWNRQASFGYNLAGSLAYVTDFGGKLTSIVRGKTEAIDSVVFNSGSSAPARVRKYTGLNGASQATATLFTGTPAYDLNRSYGGRDLLGRIVGYTQPTPTSPIDRSFTYDALNRLTAFQTIQDTSWIEINWVPWDPWGDCPGCMIEDTTYHNGYNYGGATYTYDVMGNRTDGLGGGGSIATGNRITIDDGYAITYDSAGNITGKSKTGDNRTYTWNPLGQLVTVATNSGTTTYGYDGFGRRVRKTVNGTITRYLLDGERVLIEVDATHSPVAEYTYYPGVDRPLSMRRGGVTYFYEQDEQGNVIGLISQTGYVAATHDYTPFGEDYGGGSGVVNPYRFKGREWDAEAGLYFMRARYYEPKLGRFMSEDPVGLRGGRNLTTFASNDPVNFADPKGTQCEPAGSVQINLFFFSFTIHWSGGCRSIRDDLHIHLNSRPNPFAPFQGGEPPMEHFDRSYYELPGQQAPANTSPVIAVEKWTSCYFDAISTRNGLIVDMLGGSIWKAGGTFAQVYRRSSSANGWSPELAYEWAARASLAPGMTALEMGVDKRLPGSTTPLEEAMGGGFVIVDISPLGTVHDGYKMAKSCLSAATYD